jgi:hypothetical protein
MKTNTSNQTNPQQRSGKKPMPEIRDNLDSRKNEEFPTREDMRKEKHLKPDKTEKLKQH